jgi:hypothetical protein
MLVITPYPGTRPADLSAAVGVHLPVITSWLDGLFDCAVIQNHIAVLNETVGFVDTKSGLLIKSSLMA